ncbi:MAG: germination lipoprotein GerS-related protein [Sarcina sp.]
MKNKVLIAIVVAILIITGGLALYTRNSNNSDPETIIKKILSCEQYKVDVEYKVKNSRGEFLEEAKISHENGKTKFLLEDKEQIFSKDKININYFEGDKRFVVDRNYDEFYRFFIINEIQNYMDATNTKMDIKDNKVSLDFPTDSLNENFSKVNLVINLENKQPENLNIYDSKGNVRVEVKYSNFEKQ